MGLGLHGGGVGAVEFLVRRGAKVTVTDLRTRIDKIYVMCYRFDSIFCSKDNLQ